LTRNAISSKFEIGHPKQTARMSGLNVSRRTFLPFIVIKSPATGVYSFSPSLDWKSWESATQEPLLALGECEQGAVSFSFFSVLQPLHARPGIAFDKPLFRWRRGILLPMETGRDSSPRRFGRLPPIGRTSDIYLPASFVGFANCIANLFFLIMPRVIAA